MRCFTCLRTPHRIALDTDGGAGGGGLLYCAYAIHSGFATTEPVRPGEGV